MSSLYTTINLTMSIPVVGAALIAWWRLRGAERRRLLIGVGGSLVVLLVLTAIFDNLMISSGLVAYDDSLTSGIKLGVAPLEDFAYALAAAVFVPSVWCVLTAAPRVGDRGDGSAGAPGEVPGEGDDDERRATELRTTESHTTESHTTGPHTTGSLMTERPASPGLLATLFWSSRPVSWVNTAAPFALAYFLATGGFDLVGVIGTIFFLVPYNLAMYGINDVFDYESDLRNPRKGGVEGSVLDRSRHTATLVASAVTTVPFLVYLVVVGSLESSLWLAASAFAVIAYSAKGLRFKEVPFLDSVTSAFHFVSPAIVGWTIAGAQLSGGVWACLIAFMLWGAASQAFGAVQDVRFDREAGLKSVATVTGARATVWIALGCYAAAVLVLLAAAPWPASGAAFALLPYLATVAAYVRVDDSTAETTNEGWKRFLVLNMLAGFCITQIVLWSVLVWA